MDETTRAILEAIAFLASAGGLWAANERRAATERKDREAALEDYRRALEAERGARQIADEQERREREARFAAESEARALLTQAFQDFRVQVVEQTASKASLEQVEERLLNGLDRITARLETIVSRMEYIGVELARQGGNPFPSRAVADRPLG